MPVEMALEEGDVQAGGEEEEDGFEVAEDGERGEGVGGGEAVGLAQGGELGYVDGDAVAGAGAEAAGVG